jgi:hypothetical protein
MYNFRAYAVGDVLPELVEDLAEVGTGGAFGQAGPK